jgi:hypothetical protein
LLRAAGVASDPRKLILAALGLVLTSAGWWAIGRAFGSGALAPAWPSARVVGSVGPTWPESLGTIARAVASPFVRLAWPYAAMFDPTTGPLGVFRAFLTVVWGVAVWGIVGGAIARIAVVELAGGDRPGIATALRFALRRAGALIGAPLSPLIGVSVFALLCAPIGLLYRLGPAGEAIAGVLAFLPLLAGLVMALLLVGLALGWPLMILTVAAEGEDVFDALSRSYSYVVQRPGRYLALVLLAWAIGAAGLLAVWFVANLVVGLATWGLALGGPGPRLVELFQSGTRVAGGAASTAHGFWMGVVDLLASGWVDAYFWSAAAIIYLLMRYDVDGAPMDDVYRPEHDGDRFVPEPEAAPAPPPPTEPPAGPGPEGEGPP